MKPSPLKVFVDMECLRDKNSKLIVKELAIAKLDGSIQSWMFAAPHPYDQLPQDIKYQNGWVAKNVHNMTWFDGEIPYHRLVPILQKHIPVGCRVYVKGTEKVKFFQELVSPCCN